MQRLLDVPGLLPHEGDVARVLVLDQDLPVAVEEHAARRRQREPPAVIVLRDLPELLMLRHLERPERDDEQGKDRRDQELDPRQPHTEVAPVVRL